jgi:hypothetical protein
VYRCLPLHDHVVSVLRFDFVVAECTYDQIGRCCAVDIEAADDRGCGFRMDDKVMFDREAGDINVGEGREIFRARATGAVRVEV